MIRLGVVNDQSGSTYRELVQFPNGKTIIPTGRNVVLPMPKGTKVLPAGKTAALMQMQSMPHFKSGIGDLIGSAWESFKSFTGNVFDYATHPKKLVQLAIDKFTDFTGALEPGLTMQRHPLISCLIQWFPKSRICSVEQAWIIRHPVELSSGENLQKRHCR